MVYCPDDDHMEEEVQLKAVLKSSAESKVDDGQVEQEDIAPEEEAAAADPEEMLRPMARNGRARGRKKFLERVQRSVAPVVTMRLIMTYFCLRQYFSDCQNLSFCDGRVKDWAPEQDAGADLQARWVRWLDAPEGGDLESYSDVPSENQTHKLFQKKNRRMNNSKKPENKRLGRSPRGT